MGDQFILPSIIDKEVLKPLKEAELVSKVTLFNLNESDRVMVIWTTKKVIPFSSKIFWNVKVPVLQIFFYKKDS